MAYDKIWTHSGDSHLIEPPELWGQILPAPLAARMPKATRLSEHEELIEVDGKSFTRALPAVLTKRGRDGKTIADLNHGDPEAADVARRLRDLDGEGVWGEVVYASIGLWCSLIEDRTLIREAAAAYNEWLAREIQGQAPDRLVCAAQMPLLDIGDSVAEVEHAASIGLKIVSFPTGNPPGTNPYNHGDWEPLWAAAEEAGVIIGFHIGTDGFDPAGAFRGPGGAVLNYVQTTFGGQRVAMQLVASGALDRHPNLKVLISEGGASWVPFLGDRMNEGYRQHGTFVRPLLSRLPKEILYRQVYASFQHDESACAALTAMGYQNVMFGSDYPHIEGTFGHTQKTLHELFDDVAPAVRERITLGAFTELFPHVSRPRVSVPQ